MAPKINVSAVSYINTRPFLFGLEQSDIINEIELTLDIPSVCFRNILEKKAGIGLVPVTALPILDDVNVFSGLCIGCDGPVRTVGLFSHSELPAIDEIVLDYQSSASVELVKILARNHWKISPKWTHGEPGFERTIGRDSGALIIGDRAISASEQFRFFRDLGEEWKQFTGLPFVFAVWVAGSDIPAGFLDRFSEALHAGVKSIPDVIENLKPVYGSRFDIEKYFMNNISYPLDARKKEGMNLFLKMLVGKTVFTT